MNKWVNVIPPKNDHIQAFVHCPLLLLCFKAHQSKDLVCCDFQLYCMWIVCVRRYNEPGTADEEIFNAFRTQNYLVDSQCVVSSSEQWLYKER